MITALLVALAGAAEPSVPTPSVALVDVGAGALAYRWPDDERAPRRAPRWHPDAERDGILIACSGTTVALVGIATAVGDLATYVRHPLPPGALPGPEGDPMSAIGAGFASAGAVLVLVGAPMWAVGHHRRVTGLSVAPTVRPGWAGVAAALRF